MFDPGDNVFDPPVIYSFNSHPVCPVLFFVVVIVFFTAQFLLKITGFHKIFLIGSKLNKCVDAHISGFYNFR